MLDTPAPITHSTGICAKYLCTVLSCARQLSVKGFICYGDRLELSDRSPSLGRRIYSATSGEDGVTRFGSRVMMVGYIEMFNSGSIWIQIGHYLRSKGDRSGNFG